MYFEIDPKVNPTLRELLKRITPLCSHYSIVVSFVERHTLMGSGNLLRGIDSKTPRKQGFFFVYDIFYLTLSYKGGSQMIIL